MCDPSNNFGKTENKVKLEVFFTIIKSISPSSIFAFGAIFISLPTYLVLHAIIKEKELVEKIKAQEPKNPLELTGEDAITQARRTTRVERTTTARVQNTNTNRGSSTARDDYDL